MDIFVPTDILLPRVKDYEKWAVIACDQFTSQPEYWQRVRERVGGAPSSLRLILPEAELGAHDGERAAEIAETMARYLRDGVFKEHPGCMIYVERTLTDGRVRRGVVGALDLEAYDYREGAQPPVRASERTVAERIPPRVRIRRGAPLELPHVLLLCDDERRALIEPLTACRDGMEKLYDFDLMLGGGHVAGWLMQGGTLEAFVQRLRDYTERRRAQQGGVVFAVGDGNHSLAAAKACYEEQKRAAGEKAAALPSRFALVELQNLCDEAQTFEPIHRLVKTDDPAGLLARMKEAVCAAEGHPVRWYAAGESRTVYLGRDRGPLPVGVLQAFLDADAREHPCAIDYIHGEEALRELAAGAGVIGFALPSVDKGGLFAGIASDGALPRKAFSMGRAQEKRYYLEARKIR